MIKIGKATKEQLNKLKQAADKRETFKEILGFNPLGKYEVGDTAVTIKNAEELEVYQNEWNGKKYYYIIVKVLGDKLAFTYSFYPVS